MQANKKAGQNHSSKTLQIFKGILNYAVRKEYLNHNRLLSCNFKRGQPKKIEFLTIEEVRALSLKKFVSCRLQQVADLFLFQCYTGFAYADLHNFNLDHIETIYNIHKGKRKITQWINKPRTKNNQLSTLRLMLGAKKIILKYLDLDLMGKKTIKLPVISNTKYNSYLKEVGDIMGFKTVLTTHIGRKTFGTIALNNGHRIEEVSAMLGHTNIKTTQRHYAVILRKLA